MKKTRQWTHVPVLDCLQTKTMPRMGFAIILLALHVALSAQAKGSITSSTSTLTVQAIANLPGQSLSDIVTSPTQLSVFDSGTSRIVQTDGRAVVNSLASGSMTVLGSFTKVPQSYGAGFTASSGWLDYEFAVDASSTLLIESANRAAFSSTLSTWAPWSASWTLETPSGVTVEVGGNGLDTSASWSVAVDAGSYVLRMRAVDSGNVSWAERSVAVGDFSTVYNWGIDSLPGTLDNPILPTHAEWSQFDFDILTTALMRFYDPEIATGYDFSTTDTPFASVLIPDVLPGGDSSFDLLVGSDVYAINAGETFDFTTLSPNGVSNFGIRGIDVSEGLDPNDPTAFITGLSFVDDGQVSTFQMTAVTTSTGAVPEPSSCLVFAGLGLCFGAVGWWRNRRRQVV